MDQRAASPAITEALAKRYGEIAIPHVGPWNETLDLLLAHRSIRAYRSDALPHGTLETLAANLQAWALDHRLDLFIVLL